MADVGRIVGAERSEAGVRLTVSTVLAAELQAGDSVAVNGVCLTASSSDGASFSAEAMNETLRHTSLGELESGAKINLELPVRAGDRLGGHVVQGHVDGIGLVRWSSADGFARRLEIEAPADLLRYLVARGSIAVDGVSLTIAELGEASFTVSLVPETLQRTNLGGAEPGAKVNLEVDVLAKYVERLTRR